MTKKEHFSFGLLPDGFEFTFVIQSLLITKNSSFGLNCIWIETWYEGLLAQDSFKWANEEKKRIIWKLNCDNVTQTKCLNGKMNCLNAYSFSAKITLTKQRRQKKKPIFWCTFTLCVIHQSSTSSFIAVKQFQF